MVVGKTLRRERESECVEDATRDEAGLEKKRSAWVLREGRVQCWMGAWRGLLAGEGRRCGGRWAPLCEGSLRSGHWKMSAEIHGTKINRMR